MNVSVTQTRRVVQGSMHCKGSNSAAKSKFPICDPAICPETEAHLLLLQRSQLVLSLHDKQKAPSAGLSAHPLRASGFATNLYQYCPFLASYNILPAIGPWLLLATYEGVQIRSCNATTNLRPATAHGLIVGMDLR